MSLFKQVSIILLFIFVILFTLIMGVSFNIIKDSTQKSLYENVQNSVSSISLSITNAGSDLSSIKTVINARLLSQLVEWTFRFSMQVRSFLGLFRIDSSSSVLFPATLAARATKYGGSSPSAVPKPHKKAGKKTST